MISFTNKRVKGSALIATLVLSLVITITCSLLLLAFYHFKFYQIRSDIDQRLNDDVNSAINLLLQQPSLPAAVSKDSALLFINQPGDSIYYKQELWGCYPATFLRVSYKGRSKEKSFLYGASSHQYADATVYVADHDRPLSLSGDTYIEGKAYLPKSGLRSGFFQQRGFSRKKLIEGSIASSEKKLPAIAAAVITHIEKISNYAMDTTLSFESYLPDSVTVSFWESPRFFKLSAHGLINSKTLRGRIFVISDSAITISATSRLEDVILIAPFIAIEEGCKGSMQAIALDSITVASDCHLYYPSALIGAGRKNVIGNTGATITIRENTIIEGTVLGLTAENATNIKSIVKINSGSIVKGLLYNQGFTYMNGMAEGAVFTDFFFEQRGPMSMENMLIDATIAKSKWLDWANYFSLLSGSAHQKIMKWLY